MKNFLNLYKITLRVRGKEFTKFEPITPLDKGAINRVRYRLFKKYNLPVIHRGGSFFIFGRVQDSQVSISLSDEETIILQNRGAHIIEELTEEEEVQSFLRDMVEAHNVHRAFAKEYVKRFNAKVEGKLGEIYLIPYAFNRVFKKGEDFLLMLDIRFHLVLRRNLQALLDEGRISPSEIGKLRLKPLYQEFTGKAKKIEKVANLGKDFIKGMIQRATSEITKSHWKSLLENKRLYEKAYVVFLENNYVYPASMLYIVVDFESLDERASNKIAKKVKLTPQRRIGTIREVLRKYSAVLRPWGIEINTREEEVEGIINYNSTLMDARGKTTKVETNLRKFLKHLKPFIKHPILNTFVLTVDSTSDNQLSFNRETFLKELKEFLSSKGINLNIEGEERVVAKRRIEALKKITPMLEEIQEYDLVIVFLEEYGRIDPYTEEILLYDYIKKRLLERMIPSQVVLNTTLRKKPPAGWEFILLNVAEQIMAKTGNLPYKIKGEIGEADFFIGVDISRITRGNTINVGAFTKIFAKDGTFLKYKLLYERAFGESISKKAIQELFLTLSEMEVKENSRIVIHRDGRFQGSEIQDFVNYAREFKYDVELVEIIKRQNPRIFPKEDNRIKGNFYKLNENTIILATYNNVYHGTHQPLRIRKVHGELPIQTIASQVLSLTLMNYSSFQPIKLPATTHYADKITKLLLRGIEPAQKEGDNMYWL